MGALANALTVRHRGSCDYVECWRQMQDFTANRTEQTADEIWLLEHPPVYTLGRNGKREHILRDVGIPVVPIDRGGQVTYHGPGQLVVYVLLDLKRRELGIKSLVNTLEQIVIDYLAANQLLAERKEGAPGVYVDGQKISALGLRVSRGCTYHGLSFNIDMDLAPFSDINPCGYENLEVTSCRKLGIETSLVDAGDDLVQRLQKML